MCAHTGRLDQDIFLVMVYVSLLMLFSYLISSATRARVEVIITIVNRCLYGGTFTYSESY